jgi:uncharacterized membrane protein YbhN (UPF0104 family)
MSVETKTKSRFSWLRWLGTLLAGVLILYLLSQQGWEEIGAAVFQIGWQRFLLALGVMFLSRLMVSARWHALMRSAGVEIPFAESLRLTFAGLFANNFLPSTVGGDVVRLAGAVQAGYDSAIATASLFSDRLVGMAGMVLFLPMGLVRFLSYSQAAAGVGFATVAGPDLAGKIFGKLKSFTRRIFDALVIWLKRPQGLLLGLLFTLGHILCLILIYDILLRGMGEQVSFWEIGGLQSLVYFVTLVPISINGWGLQELSITFAFTELARVGANSSLTLGLLIRTLFILASLPGALYVRAILPQVRGQK